MKVKEPKTRGQRIRSIRGEMTQAEYAEALGIKQAMVSRYEADKETPSPHVVLKIAQYGQTSIEWILTGKDAQFARSKRRGNNIKFSKAKFVTSIVKDVGNAPLPFAEEFSEMMKDLFGNRKRMREVIGFYRYMKYRDKGKK